MSERIKVLPVQQPAPGERKLIRAKGKEIALFNLEGAFYALDNSCPHSTGPLVEGHWYGSTVTCPWHGSQFDITTGQCQAGPATERATVYPVYVEDNMLFIEI